MIDGLKRLIKKFSKFSDGKETTSLQSFKSMRISFLMIANPRKNSINATKDGAIEKKWAEEFASDLVAITNLKSDMKVLDVACGQGLVTIYLTLYGLNIEGRDFSQTMLNFAMEHCKDLDVKMNFVQQDMFKMEDQSAFDVLMLRDVIWGGNSNEMNRLLLKKFNVAIKRGGSLILEVYNKTVALEKQPLEGVFTYDTHINRFTGKVGPEDKTEFLTFEVLTSAEWKDLLSKFGFAEIQIIPALPFRKRGLDSSKSLINYLIATKH